LHVFKLVCTRWENFIRIGITVLYSLIRLNWVNLEYNGYYTRLIVLVLFVMFLLTPFFVQYITSDIIIQSVLVTLLCWNRHFTFTVILTDKIIRKKSFLHEILGQLYSYFVGIPHYLSPNHVLCNDESFINI
jgi:hypothetical protein